MIDANSPVKSQPRMTREKFVAVLTNAGSPWFALGASLYNLIVGKGHDPAFWLAIAGREHSFGTAQNSVLVIDGTNSWTNARTVRDPDVKKRSTIITSKKNGTEYVKYQTVGDSLLDGMYRLDDPTYRYQQEGRHSIGQVLAIWTESESVPYTQYVVDRINEWSETGGAMPFEMPDIINGIPLHKRFIPTKNSNRPGTPATASGQQWITVHETANPTVGANAKMHNEFVFNGGGANPAEGNDGVSFTFAVDDHEIWQNLPLEEKSWQASDGSNGDGNSSVSIETCVNADGDWNKTKFNLANLVAFLATHVPNKSMDRVAQHNKWARDHKNCPTRLRANNNAEWDAWLAQARGIAAGGVIIPPDGSDPVTHKFIAADFRPYYDAHGGVDVLGRPVTGAFIEDGRLVQYCERNVMQAFPENADPYKVQLRLLGAEELARRYPSGAPA